MNDTSKTDLTDGQGPTANLPPIPPGSEPWEFYYFPVLPGSKKPAVEGWQTVSTNDPKTVLKWLADGYNLGLDTGKSGLLIPDLDGGEIGEATWARLQAEHGPAPATFEARTPRGGRHLYYRGAGPNSVQKLGRKVDTRGAGGYVLCPPSTVDGQPYTVARDVPLADVPEWVVAALETAGTATAAPSDTELDTPANVARATLWLQGRPEVSQGDGADAKTYEAACGLRDMGIGAETSLELMLEHYRCSPQDDRYEGFLTRKIESAWSYGQNEPGAWAAGDPVARFSNAVAQSVEASDLVERVFDPWAADPVPPFPLALLPRDLREFVRFQALTSGIDPSAYAMAALTGCSGAIDHRFTVKPMSTSSWATGPRLWSLLIGQSGTGKSPAIDACTRPVYQAQDPLLAVYRKEFAQWKARSKKFPEDIAPEPPVRYVVSDVTPEALGEILADQDRGLLAVRQEISALFGGMGRYGGKAAVEAEFWLQARDGGRFNFDRIGRGGRAGIAVRHCSMSLLGGIQPRVLAKIEGLQDNGMLQRFAPVMMRQPEAPQEAEGNLQAAGRYESLIGLLLGLAPRQLALSADGKAIAAELDAYLKQAVQLELISPGFCGFLNKMGSVFGALAIILHLACDPLVSTEEIGTATAKAARDIILKFIIPHGVAFYRSLGGTGSWEELQPMAGFVLRKRKARYTPADFTAGVRELRGLKGRDLEEKIGQLVNIGWLTPDRDAFPARAWLPAAGLYKAFEERAAIELRLSTERNWRLQQLQTFENEPEGAVSDAEPEPEW